MKSGNMYVTFEFQKRNLIHFKKEAYKYLVLTVLSLRA